MRSIHLLLALSFALTAASTACRQVEEVELPTRAIQWTRVGESAEQRVRRISGVTESLDHSQLSFEVPGKVERVLVKIGDSVEKGDLLAQIDRRPFELTLERARAAVSEARAQTRAASSDYGRVRLLFESDNASKAELDHAEARLASKRSEYRAAYAQLDLARRDLRHTELRAPFAGTVARKRVEAFEQVTPGRPVFEIDGRSGFKAEVEVPGTITRNLASGQTFVVHFPTLRGVQTTGTVEEIGTRAETADVFRVSLKLSAPPAEIRVGLPVEVAFTLPDREEDAPHEIPLSAVLPGEGAENFVFAFDPESGVVAKVPVKVSALGSHSVAVSSGLQSGQIIATAGVAFLSDGMKVSLLDTGDPIAVSAGPHRLETRGVDR